MTGAFRTASGGRIDRSRTISFRFDGDLLAGHPGDTLASALLASGRHLVGRSFKYHRPRGILTAGSEDQAKAERGQGMGGSRSDSGRCPSDYSPAIFHRSKIALRWLPNLRRAGVAFRA